MSEEKEAGPSDLSWVIRRELVVQQAIDNGDFGRLRELAALPGGFGSNEMRKKVWPILLGTQRYIDGPGPKHEVDDDSPSDLAVDSKTLNGQAQAGRKSEDTANLLLPHREEEQVQKDTHRSFVSYPKGLPSESKEALQVDLQDLIVGVLRKYPTLSYFQGYHDILSVLYLTYIPLPSPSSSARSSRKSSRAPSRSGDLSREDEKDQEVHDEEIDLRAEGQDVFCDRDTEDWRILRQCAEVISLCRVRDAMGPGMEAMMGYLRILKRLLRAADPEISRFSAMISPVPTLPFFALSWILTLFSHDVDTLDPIQRMFDYLLARNPISAIYLAVAILVAKKPQMMRLVKEMGQDAMDDPSVLHPFFARLPPLIADTPDTPETEASTRPQRPDFRSRTEDGTDKNGDQNPYEPIALSTIFKVADDLMARYPWDGPLIRGHEILGEASSVVTYTQEDTPTWSLRAAENLVNGEVVRAGAATLDDDSEEDEEEAIVPPIRPRRQFRIRLPRNRVGTLVAFGVILLGVGIAVYGSRSGGPRSNWARWWSVVIRDAVSRRGYAGSVRECLISWTTAGSDAVQRGLERIF